MPAEEMFSKACCASVAEGGDCMGFVADREGVGEAMLN